MRLLIALFTALFAALALSVTTGCATTKSNAPRANTPAAPAAEAPPSLDDAEKLEMLEMALKRTRKRIDEQRAWLDNLKSAEDALSDRKVDDGW